MSNEIKTQWPADTIGKTIQAVRYASFDMTAKFLFTDGTFLVLEARRDKYDDSHTLQIGDHSDISDYDLRELGVIDEAECQRRTDARNNARHDDDHQRRLQQWRALNKEFAGTPDPPKPDCTCAICQAQGDGACKDLTNLLDATIGKPQ